MTSPLPGSPLRKLAAIALLVVISFVAQAQLSQRSEVGFGLGTFVYTGDLSRTYNIAFSKPAATVFYRHNISKVISLRVGFIGGRIGASDKLDPIDPFAKKRNASFNVFLLETSGTLEYHFLDWRDERRRLRYTPYLFTGLGLFSISGNQPKTTEYSNVQLCIPLGGGFKYVLNPNWYIAFEFGIRKTFFDYLDNIGAGDPKYKNYKYGNGKDYDNYFFAGITLTRTFYDIPCPRTPY